LVGSRKAVPGNGGCFLTLWLYGNIFFFENCQLLVNQVLQLTKAVKAEIDQIFGDILKGRGILQRYFTEPVDEPTLIRLKKIVKAGSKSLN
jgi:hypothetical protein